MSVLCMQLGINLLNTFFSPSEIVIVVVAEAMMNVPPKKICEPRPPLQSTYLPPSKKASILQSFDSRKRGRGSRKRKKIHIKLFPKKTFLEEKKVHSTQKKREEESLPFLYFEGKNE